MAGEKIRTGATRMILMSAPNGARKMPSDHPALPITASDIARTAAEVCEAGASMIHVHVRDKAGAHLLDAAAYSQVTQAIRREVGDRLVVQITTEAVGRYTAAEQIKLVREVRAEAVSLAVREIIPDEEHEAEAAALFNWMLASHVAPQFIVYDANDLRRFHALRDKGVIPFEEAFLLFVLGRYSQAGTASARDLVDFLQVAQERDIWSVCAFRDLEHKATVLAAILGGHARVGFENNTLLPDGTTAENNAALVRSAAQEAVRFDRTLATAFEVRQILGMG
ncbi:3-keto-5-aminohexanoate cleavage protein [Rhizobiales bacterium]|uniref:3-keto-5-aminohexanoate cleavage protein n=1 Tax=Hongsoonwoonella zoysiae TaxID=2821844 RepID=UPI0015617F43|nr:3-keto-5-aminohexanoate cleavage protein [Hongsoonwoonella zoysiae]NRG19562.1 3-keto-5-aminohexanoate cleavage protein [Hongsoonwoonella zoysiae]